jgi:transcriptional regulator GlxA family with amidase domain
MRRGAKWRIGIIGYDEVTALDLFDPAEAFGSANLPTNASSGALPYEIFVLGLSSRPFRTELGIRCLPTATLEAAPAMDTVIIPGGRGLRRPEISTPVVNWLKQRAPRLRRLASVCTGIYGLAAAGFLDGRRVTTHWRFAPDVRKKFPALKVESDALYLKDGKYYTSAGITAGIDLALALIEEDLGSKTALAVARELVVYVKRSGGQEQFSAPLQFQTQAPDEFADLVAWITGSLEHDLSVQRLADRAGLCSRHFSRKFKATFGCPPATFVNARRLDEGRRRLESTAETIGRIAASVGYASADVFRRAFEHRFGVTPSNYRDRFPAR